MPQLTIPQLTKQVFTSFYNLVSDTQVSVDEFVMSPPMAVQHVPGEAGLITPVPNTYIELQLIPGKGKYGEPYLHYNRINVETLGSVREGTPGLNTSVGLSNKIYVDVGAVQTSVYTDEIPGAFESLLSLCNVGNYISSAEVDDVVHYQLVGLTGADLHWHALVPDSYTYLAPSATVQYLGLKRVVSTLLETKWDSYYCYSETTALVVQDYYPPVKWVGFDAQPATTGDPIEIVLGLQASAEPMVIGVVLDKTLQSGKHYTWVGASATNGVVVHPEALVVPAGVTNVTLSIPTLAGSLMTATEYKASTIAGVDGNGQLIPGIRVSSALLTPN